MLRKLLSNIPKYVAIFQTIILRALSLVPKSATKALVPVFQNYREIFLYCCVWTIVVYFLTKTQSEGEAGPLHDQSTGQR